MAAKNNRIRFDEYLVLKKNINSRHHAADLIRRKQVKLNGRIIDKPALRLDLNRRQRIQLQTGQLYVSRGGYKLESANKILNLSFKDKIILDAGAHQGGFTDFILRQRAGYVVAVDVGRQALSPSLSSRDNVLAFTQTDIRDFVWPQHLALPDYIVVDLSFISLTKVLADLLKFCHQTTQVLVLAKPQFEAEGYTLRKGIVKNKLQRKAILGRLEIWFRENQWIVKMKTDSKITGLKGNLERFYLLKPVRIGSSTDDQKTATVKDQ